MRILKKIRIQKQMEIFNKIKILKIIKVKIFNKIKIILIKNKIK
jgi:hypothetical protein